MKPHDGQDLLPLTFRRYGMRGTPTTILIDRVGRLRAHEFGALSDMELASRSRSQLRRDDVELLTQTSHRPLSICRVQSKEFDMTTHAIPGYGYDTAAPSPVTEADLTALKASVLFGPDDTAALAMAGDILADQIDAVLDVWYGFVGSQPHLLAYFSTPQGTPLPDYLDRVRARFGQWIMDTCRRPYDAQWLAYADEIGRRHIPPAKNHTDDAPSVPIVPLRHMIAFIYPVTATIRPFLANTGATEVDVERMHQAWFKSITMQVAVWLRPYARDGHW